MSQPVTLSCPYCAAPLNISGIEMATLVPVSCEGCGKVIDLNPMVAAYELMLKYPEVHLKRMAGE